MNIDDGDFVIGEIQRAKLKICEGKVSGPDGIPPEVIKRCNFDNIILELSNKLLNENVIPEQWTEIKLLPILKSGDLSQNGNYRRINLSSQVAKIVNK